MNKILLEVIGLSYTHSQSGAYALILGKNNEKLRLPIIIGEAEAQSIAIAIEGYTNKRPHTHDLFKTFAETYGISITEVVISRFKDGLFFSELHCIKDGEKSILDARPSDAVAIATRLNIPIYVNSQVLEEAGVDIDDLDNDYDYDYDMGRYDINDLEFLLEKAIDDEDYTTASKLRDSINERKRKKE